MPSAIAGTFRRALWLQGQGALSFFLEQTLSIIVIDILIAHDKDWSLGLLVLIAFLQAPATPPSFVADGMSPAGTSHADGPPSAVADGMSPARVWPCRCSE